MYSQIKNENKCLKIVTVVYFLNFNWVEVMPYLLH
ncbi:hypothetical protein SAMN03159353_100153 [Cedecea sp. NFIX57]|nr:hypothetical protein SAMN03159353_100153 [Cedecea sp. NFIX57]